MLSRNISTNPQHFSAKSLTDEIRRRGRNALHMTALQASSGTNLHTGGDGHICVKSHFHQFKSGGQRGTAGGLPGTKKAGCTRSVPGASFGTPHKNVQSATCRNHGPRGGSPRLEARGSHRMQHRAFAAWDTASRHAASSPRNTRLEASQAAVPRSSPFPNPSHHLIPFPQADRQSAIETGYD